jgi:hypothetical protein
MYMWQNHAIDIVAISARAEALVRVPESCVSGELSILLLLDTDLNSLVSNALSALTVRWSREGEKKE